LILNLTKAGDFERATSLFHDRFFPGSLERELDRAQDAEISFQKALLLPDRMLAYHFTRLAKSAATP